MKRLKLFSRRNLIAALGLAASCAAFSAQAAISAAERTLLIELYGTTHGSNWTMRTNWCTRADGMCTLTDSSQFSPPGTECNWFGVTCDYDSYFQHVIAIDLSNNNLQGNLLLNFCGMSFTHLQRFNVSYNALEGTIPDLAATPMLVGFDVRHNRLTGPIPGGIGRQINLVSFLASDNQLSGPIPEISNMPSLEEFIVSNNRLTGSIPSLAGLPNLISLILDHNNLSGSVPSLSGAMMLQWFDVSHNILNGTLPAPPLPPYMHATLCPNPLAHNDDPKDRNAQILNDAWGVRTGYRPWWTQSKGCTG